MCSWIAAADVLICPIQYPTPGDEGKKRAEYRAGENPVDKLWISCTRVMNKNRAGFDLPILNGLKRRRRHHPVDDFLSTGTSRQPTPRLSCDGRRADGVGGASRSWVGVKPYL